MQHFFTRFSSECIQKIVLLLLCILVGVKSQAQNLIVNGNFSNGNANFTSEYTYTTQATNGTNYSQGLGPEGRYTVGTNPKYYHQDFCALTTEGVRSPISGGNMLIGNGYNGSSKKLWTQTVALQANTNYKLTFYAMSLAGANTLLFGLYGNCTRLGQDIDVGNTCTWTLYTMTFNSGVLTSLELSLRNISVNASGNDIAVDDIILVKDNPATNYATISDDFIWQGYTTDWTNADNWGSCTVPTCSDDVVIPAGLTNYPILASNATGAVKSITIQSGAKVTLNSGSELQVCGDLLNSGTLTTNSTATITMMGTT
ncbi:hypothetical protein, partial [Xanthocytophaga agilis]